MFIFLLSYLYSQWEVAKSWCQGFSTKIIQVQIIKTLNSRNFTKNIVNGI